jgi:CRP/FNR family transcriptional regulator, cyclic AMP receptor protein
MSSMDKQRRAFSPKTFLTTDGAGRTLISFRKGQTIYSQGNTADALFVIQSGKVQLRVKSQNGKYATLDIVSDEDFVGEDSIAGY